MKMLAFVMVIAVALVACIPVGLSTDRSAQETTVAEEDMQATAAAERDEYLIAANEIKGEHNAEAELHDEVLMELTQVSPADLLASGPSASFQRIRDSFNRVRVHTDASIQALQGLSVPVGCRDFHRTAVDYFDLLRSGLVILEEQYGIAAEQGFRFMDASEINRADKIIEEVAATNVERQFQLQGCVNS